MKSHFLELFSLWWPHLSYFVEIICLSKVYCSWLLHHKNHSLGNLVIRKCQGITLRWSDKVVADVLYRVNPVLTLPLYGIRRLFVFLLTRFHCLLDCLKKSPAASSAFWSLFPWACFQNENLYCFVFTHQHSVQSFYDEDEWNAITSSIFISGYTSQFFREDILIRVNSINFLRT
jgi:hypothetical protein